MPFGGDTVGKGIVSGEGPHALRKESNILQTAPAEAALGLTSELWPSLVLDAVTLGMEAFITLSLRDQCVSQWRGLGTQSHKTISSPVKSDWKHQLFLSFPKSWSQ